MRTKSDVSAGAGGGLLTDRLALTELEAAQALGVSPKHLANQRKKGLVPHKAIGDRITYPVDVLQKFLADGTTWSTSSDTGGESSQA